MAKKKLRGNQALASARGSSRSEFSSSRRSSNIGFRLTGGYHLADQKRNVWGVAGYPDKVQFDMHWNMAARFGIAHAGIHRIVNKCWEKPPKVTDGEHDDNAAPTPFELDLDILIKKHKLFTRLKGLDWRQRIGRYGAIIPIVRQSAEELRDTREPMPGLMGIQSVIKLFPVTEAQADVTDIGTNSDLNSEFYGDPLYFNFRQEVVSDRNPVDNRQYQLHPSRLFVYAEGADDGSIYGIPTNEAGYNSLLDLEKICTSGAEGLFKNAKQRTVYSIDDSQVAGTLLTDDTKRQQWNDSNDSFHSGFDSSQILYGMNAQVLQSTLADPTHPFTNALNIYAASINIPATILIGQQTGRLASDEDQKEWGMSAQTRCENVLTPMIKEFLEYLVRIGAMSPPKNEVMVEWDEFVTPSQSDKLGNAKIMEEINKSRYEAGRSGEAFTGEEVRKVAGFEAKAEDGEPDDFEKEEPPAMVKMPGQPSQSKMPVKDEGK